MPFLIFLTLFMLLNPSCAGVSADIKFEINTDHIDGKVFNDTTIKIFDGLELRDVSISKNRFNEAHGITFGYYGVVFFTRNGFYPEVKVFEGDSKLRTEVILNKLEDTKKGVLTGVVYKPITGGKLKRHRGIFEIFKDEKIDIVKDSIHQTVGTDDMGVFTILLAEGEYNMMMGGKEIDKVVIEPGKTTIKNIQKGMVLMD